MTEFAIFYRKYLTVLIIIIIIIAIMDRFLYCHKVGNFRGNVQLGWLV